MKGLSSFPKIICYVLLLGLAGSTAFAEEPQLRRAEDLRGTPPTETSRQLENASELKPSLNVRREADPAPREDVGLNLHAIQKQYSQCLQSEEELKEQVAALQLQNTSLQQQLQVVQEKLNEATHPGGSAVTAYCESSSVSRNTAGATTDCGPFECEQVSGLCRTQCDSSSQCSKSYVCDLPYRQCIPAN